MENKTLGQIAFEAYAIAKGGIGYDGAIITAWGKLSPGVQPAWEAAAKAVEQEASIRFALRKRKFAPGEEENAQ
mgnify:CR=1 FL=1